jgi:hypothetical protein
MEEWKMFFWSIFYFWGITIHVFRIKYMGSCGSVVGIVTRLQAGWVGVQILVCVRNVSLIPNVQTSSGAHPVPYSMGTGVLSRV